MMREVWSWAVLIVVVVLLHIVDPRLALGGIVGLVGGNWTRWDSRIRKIMGS